MPDRFPGTTLTKLFTQGGLPDDPAQAFGRMSEETDKALLDLLKKVNETSASAADKDSTAASITGINSAMAAAIKGMKYGLDVAYVSADVLSISPGAVEVNGEIVSIDAPLAITASMPNFPAAGAWAFVTMERGGTHRLFPATGAGTVRPSDNCFQLTGGGVGFDDIGKQGYYLDPERRIIDVIHRVNATTWYAIKLGRGLNEYGNNGNGAYVKLENGDCFQRGAKAFDVTTIVNRNIGTYGWSFYYGSSAITFPIPFAAGSSPVIMTNGNDSTATGYGSNSSAASIANASFLLIGYFYGSALGIGYGWDASGYWK